LASASARYFRAEFSAAPLELVLGPVEMMELEYFRAEFSAAPLKQWCGKWQRANTEVSAVMMIEPAPHLSNGRGQKAEGRELDHSTWFRWRTGEARCAPP